MRIIEDMWLIVGQEPGGTGNECFLMAKPDTGEQFRVFAVCEPNHVGFLLAEADAIASATGATVRVIKLSGRVVVGEFDGSTK